MEFSTLSLQERERLAYIAGETKLARALAEQIELQEELEETQRELHKLEDMQ